MLLTSFQPVLSLFFPLYWPVINTQESSNPLLELYQLQNHHHGLQMREMLQKKSTGFLSACLWSMFLVPFSSTQNEEEMSSLLKKRIKRSSRATSVPFFCCHFDHIMITFNTDMQLVNSEPVKKLLATVQFSNYRCNNQALVHIQISDNLLFRNSQFCVHDKIYLI